MEEKDNSTQVVAIIQTHYSDLLPDDTDPSHYCISALLNSRYIKKIVLAAPDIPQNRVFTDLARQWNIDCFFGYEYDVVKRLIQAAKIAGDLQDVVIVRVLLNRFYLDIYLVDRMIDQLIDTRSDYVMLPYDFNINFGADVLSYTCLVKLDNLLPESEYSHWRFHPWLYIEENPEIFKLTTFNDVPLYPSDRLAEIRTSNLFLERDCGTCTTFTYEFILQFLKSTDIVLDIACGTGEGSVQLAKKCKCVHAADLSNDTIQGLRNKFKLSNLSYDVQDACNMSYSDNYFDAVVCLNTLEHIEDDKMALKNIYRVLRPEGRLILEVPLLKRRPFNYPLISSHLREYDKEPLLRMLSKHGFIIERKYGMNRGQYVDWERARESVLITSKPILG